MREKLSELIQSSVGGCTKYWADVIADHLLANGVIAPPVKVGQKVYFIHQKTTVLCGCVAWIETNEKGWEFAVKYPPLSPKFFAFEDFGKTVFHTREEAEKALKGAEG